MNIFKALSHIVLGVSLLLGSALNAQESSPPPITVGTTQSLSGRFADEGTRQLEGMLMWVNDLNARGAMLGRKVELIHYDDHSDPDRVAMLYDKLINERKVDLLIGPYSSELTLRATDVAEQANFPIVTAAASAEQIWARGYKNVFGIDVPSKNYMDIAVQEAAKRGAKTIALFYAEGDFAEDVPVGVRREAKSQGMQIVMDREYKPDEVDFQQLAKELRAVEAKTDIILGATYLADSVAIGKALGPGKRLEVDMVALTVGPAISEFGPMLNNNVDGVVGVVQWLRSVRLPGAQDFAYRYRQIYGHNPGVHAAIGYSAGQVTEAAVRLAGTTEHDAVRNQLRNMRFNSLIGYYQVDENGRQMAKRNYLLQWQDNRRRLVAPELIAERELIYPRP